MNRHGRRAARREAGFTLVELLVAVVLVGLLIAGLFGGLRFGARATERITATADRAAQLALAYGFLQAQLGNAQPYPVAPDDPRNRTIIFDGSGDRLEAITTSPSRLAAGGFFRLQLATTEEGGQTRLTARWENPPRTAGQPTQQELEPVVLLDHLEALRFAYFGRSDPDDPNDWHERWQGARVLPKMIRIRVQFTDGSQAPDLIVAPRLAEDPDVNG